MTILPTNRGTKFEFKFGTTHCPIVVPLRFVSRIVLVKRSKDLDAMDDEQINEAFDPSAILSMDDCHFQDHESDYGDDESIDIEEEDSIDDIDDELKLIDDDVKENESNDDLIHVDKIAPIFSSMIPMIQYDKGLEEMNEAFLGELVRNGLFGFYYPIGNPEEISGAIDHLVNAGFFTSKHDNDRRSLSISTYGSHLFRTMSIFLSVSIFKKFFDWIEEAFNCMIVNVWAFHFIETGGGKFAFHRDKFKSKWRLIFTLGDSKKGKLMRFVNRQTGDTVALKIPSGTVIGMSRVVSGADKERGGMYFHEVRNCEGTISFGFQLMDLRKDYSKTKRGHNWKPTEEGMMTHRSSVTKTSII